MNIREAAKQLRDAALAYSARTPEGAYRVPLAAQRPLYLIGPPGVGKTAVVAQTAAELGIGFAAYTMTHHTRQSALGLPMIAHRTIHGEERSVTEYTMSEIVASVWQKVEAGAETGILFLDEINCVSESLMPAMLQLLQYKTFGVHDLPRGWMIVCAGNPPKYNRYAHTFDAVVMDRLRVIEVEPDLKTWLGYAAVQGVHPLIRSYLTLKPGDFYVPDGDRIITARSWTDLSEVMLAMEAEKCDVDDGLFRQYLQAGEVAERFGLYARLCRDTGAMLDKAVDSGNVSALSGLPFDEAVFAALFLAGTLECKAMETDRIRRVFCRLENFAAGVEREYDASHRGVEQLCRDQIERLKRSLTARSSAGILNEAEQAGESALIARLERIVTEIHGLPDREALKVLHSRVASKAQNVEAEERLLESMADRTLACVEHGFEDPNVRLIFLCDIKSHETVCRLIENKFAERLKCLWQTSDPEKRMQ